MIYEKTTFGYNKNVVLATLLFLEKSMQTKDKVELGLLVIRSKDMDRAGAFYSALGLPLIRHAHPPCGEHFSTEGSDAVLEIYQSKANENIAPLFFGLNVPDVARALEIVAEEGGSIVRHVEDSTWGRSATILDLDGHKVMLIERG